MGDSIKKQTAEAIRTVGLTKRYKDLTAVDHLELVVKQGELFSLLGVNGAGKTTAIKMLSCLIVHLIFMVIMIGLFLCFGWFPKITWVQALYYTFGVTMYTIALVYFTCSIQVFFKDMSQIVSICLQFGMWLIPIMWREEQFLDRAFYPVLSIAMKLNPMYYIVVGYRDSLLLGNWFWQRPTMTLYFWGVTIGLFLAGLKVFKRLRPHFSDVL